MTYLKASCSWVSNLSNNKLISTKSHFFTGSLNLSSMEIFSSNVSRSFLRAKTLFDDFFAKEHAIVVANLQATFIRFENNICWRNGKYDTPRICSNVSGDKIEKDELKKYLTKCEFMKIYNFHQMQRTLSQLNTIYLI